MVCYETYKDNENNWLFPDEVFTEDGKSFYKKNSPKDKVIRGNFESMSKSKKNIIDPENIISNYGADSVRIFILSDSPPEKEIKWTEQGIKGAYKFVQKFWILHEKIKIKIKSSNKNDELENENLNKFTNVLIDKITNNLEKFNLNVVVANFYEIFNFLNKIVDKNIDGKTLEKNYYDILKIMFPISPHLSSECINDLGKNLIYSWPEPEKNYLIEKNVDVVIQINGKKRAIINVKKGSDEENITNKAIIEKNVKKYVENKKIIKKIYVKDRLLNLIIK